MNKNILHANFQSNIVRESYANQISERILSLETHYNGETYASIKKVDIFNFFPNIISLDIA